ncbi:SulP family inorganic anion transporter [Curvibacter gracilis]|uniref:SulP family inorganic anion transporter n=1 Tax=Curvibacter gracilis TaxID=230310 RepID=UPI0012FCE7FF|nr:SulP family inorganic anion transporter [Curvibacter gracilis]
MNRLQWLKPTSGRALGRDIGAGVLGALVFFNEYLSLANSAAGGHLAQDLPLWVGRTSLRCVLAVIVAVLLVTALSLRPRQLIGPRASPMLVLGWLLWVGWQLPPIQAQGMLGLSWVATGLVVVAGLTQLMLALFRAGPWMGRTLSPLVIGATLFAGAIGMISSEVGKLANCAPTGNWQGLMVAASVVVLNLIWKLVFRKRKAWKDLGLAVGMVSGCAVYFVWREVAPDPGLCRTLGSAAANPGALIEWLDWSGFWPALQEPRLVLLLSLGGLGLGTVCTADTFSALNMLTPDPKKDPQPAQPLSLNWELLVNGAGNFICGLLCLPPVATSLSRSQLQAAQDGGALAALFHGLTLAALLAWGLPLVALIPQAVLAGCVVLVAMDMLTEPLRTLMRWMLHEHQPSPALGRAVLLVLLVVAVGLGVHNSAIGMVCGLLLSWLGLLIARPRASATLQWRGQALELSLDGDWLFFNARHTLDALEPQFQAMCQTLRQAQSHPPTSLVLRLHNIGRVDFLALSQLQKTLTKWTQSGLPLGIEGAGQVPDEVLRLLWHQTIQAQKA